MTGSIAVARYYVADAHAVRLDGHAGRQHVAEGVRRLKLRRPHAGRRIDSHHPRPRFHFPGVEFPRFLGGLLDVSRNACVVFVRRDFPFVDLPREEPAVRGDRRYVSVCGGHAGNCLIDAVRTSFEEPDFLRVCGRALRVCLGHFGLHFSATHVRTPRHHHQHQHPPSHGVLHWLSAKHAPIQHRLGVLLIGEAA